MSDMAFKFDYEQEAERLSAENAALRADAERYRWLRPKWRNETAYDRYEGARWWCAFYETSGLAKDLDAAIDAAKEQR